MKNQKTLEELLNEKWVKSYLKLDEYPLGTKAKSFNGGYWVKVVNGWEWCTGSVFPSLGGDWNGMVCL